jgi:phosphoribosylaminoimidazolecarboxamide formyltransferase/IMP cyclohydrolase
MVNVVSKIDDLVKVRQVLISVSDKAGLERFVPGLLKACPGVRFLSTGGTFSRLAEILGPDAGRRLLQVSDYTGQPETQGGLVKTLDFKIYLGLLTETYNPAHQKDLKRAGARPIDMVVVNLYPFAATVARPGVSVEEARANIDIGGPCMVRAAAKNYLRVAAVVDPDDYPKVLSELAREEGNTTLKLRYELARKAFAHTALYDTAIASYLRSQNPARMKKAYDEIV